MAVLTYIFEGVGNEMGRFLWPDRQKSSSRAQNQWVFVAKWGKNKQSATKRRVFVADCRYFKGLRANCCNTWKLLALKVLEHSATTS